VAKSFSHRAEVEWRMYEDWGDGDGLVWYNGTTILKLSDTAIGKTDPRLVCLSTEPITKSMSSFIAKKLDTHISGKHTRDMGRPMNSERGGRTATLVRKRIERGGERLWRLEDFRDLSFEAAAQALSRLTRKGLLERLSKGVYYRSRETSLGASRPNPATIRKLASRSKSIFPSGIAAANLLGFTTQTARRIEVATSALSLPRKLVGEETAIHARRPKAWERLSEADAAILDFLRRAGQTSELSPAETIRKTLALLAEGGRFERLLRVADTEPPRVRAMLGAIGDELGRNQRTLKRLRESLNPFSKFNFGVLAGLTHARDWQAREHRSHETV
jgi:Family of unknown function (DUF6088)